MQSASSNAVSFDPRSPEFAADPYPFYALLRRDDPVHRNPHIGMWFVTRHADVARVFTEPVFGKREPAGVPPVLPPVPPDLARLAELPPDLLELDPPDHTRIRSLVAKAFTPREVERVKPRVARLVDELLDAQAERGALDVVEDFAFPIPATVIAELLGVPPEDRPEFRAWTSDLVRGLDVTQPEDVRHAGMAARLRLADYVGGLVEERRAAPRDDLISALVHVEEEGERLTSGELLSNCILLLFAGFETTVNLISLATRNLLLHPAQRERFLADPDVTANAVEEVMRYESPVQRIGYITQEDVEIGGCVVPRGEVVLAVIGSANRDPDVFPDPDSFDVGRRTDRHLGFGRGAHFCFGAMLARLEAGLALRRLFDRFDGLRLVDPEPVWAPTSSHRKLLTLPVEFDVR